MPQDRNRNRNRNQDRNKNRKRGQDRRDRKGKGKREPFNLSEPYTKRKQFKRERQAASTLQFQDTDRQLDKEAAAEQELRNRIPSYFANYQAELDRGAAATAAAYASADAKTKEAELAAQQYDTKLREQMATEAQADAAIRGTSAGNVSADSAAAASSRSQASADFATLLAAQGATNAAHVVAQKGIASGEEQSQLMKSHARERSLNEDRRALAKEKGAFNIDFRRQERADERDYRLSNKEFRFQKKENAKDRALSMQQSLLTARGDRASSRSQMKLARQYGQNRAQEQATSLSNQLRVGRQQRNSERADDRRTRRRDRGVQAGYNRAERQDDARTRARDRRQNAANRGGDEGISERQAAGWLRSAPARYGKSRQAAIDYLLNRNVSPAVARRVVDRMMGRGGSSTPSINAELND